jgi:RNA polymerase sigma-70 factor (ECF subfamily)
MQTDASLVTEAMQGDRSAYACLYDRYVPLIRSVCYDTTGNLTDAQDLAQEIFLRAYSKLDTLRNGDRFGAWIVGIARHVCRDWLRNRSRRKTCTLNTKFDLKNEDCVEYGEETLVQLHEAMAELSQRERLALQAFYLNGQSADQARRLLGLSQSGFYKILERSRTKLASLMLREQEPQ